VLRPLVGRDRLGARAPGGHASSWALGVFEDVACPNPGGEEARSRRDNPQVGEAWIAGAGRGARQGTDCGLRPVLPRRPCVAPGMGDYSAQIGE
jgi:hypothetical protein